VAKPSFVVSHEVGMEEAVDAYDKFDRRVDGYTKVRCASISSCSDVDLEQVLLHPNGPVS